MIRTEANTPMHSQIRKAMEADAARQTAESVAALVPRLDDIENRLGRIEAILREATSPPRPAPAVPQPRGDRR